MYHDTHFWIDDEDNSAISHDDGYDSTCGRPTDPYGYTHTY